MSPVPAGKENHASIKKPVFTLETMNKNVVNVQYAVRGELALRAEAIKEELQAGKKLAFDKVIHCNICNPQQLDQQPITFFRQVAALTEYPELMRDPKKIEGLFPKDAIERAQTLLKGFKTLGAYSHSKGVPYIRQRIAEFIERRDGFPSDPEDIFLTSGASSGVLLVMQLLIENSNVGVMLPVPQYPLYTAACSLFDAKTVSYALDEENDWALDVNEMRTRLHEARAQGTDVRALVVINPSNPTGHCMKYENMKQVVEMCHEEGLLLMVDEVYQENVYDKQARPFHSFKKVVRSMGEEYSDFELISFHSVSKGVAAECGRRGGYFELAGIDPRVNAQLYKLASVSLCPNISGQFMLDLVLNPPQEGDPSYELFHKETTDIFSSLKRRSEKLCAALNKLEGVSCNKATGSMDLFPQIRLPEKAIKKADEQGKKGDEFYAMEMLNAIGVCVVPGAGFKQKAGTHHFRTTVLPP
ncbi:alanine transaminase [Entomophthora muscae]|uniref:Alanine transaminase n=1 Tax=Entomophthora muscae TaxID=34485 RepID=A0ACC2RY30_9FUNG|nr:alanine transaminase [Entomophthora muscae]